MGEKLQIYHFWTGLEKTPVDSVIRKFKEKFTSINVKTHAVEWGVYFPTLLAKIAEGNPPDISTTEIGLKLMKLAEDDHLVDLTDLWQKEEYSEVFPSEMKMGCGVGGKMYGVPSKEYTFAVWYLTDVFKGKGIHPPKNWDGFLKLCEEFKEEGMCPVVSSRWGTSLWLAHILTGLAGPEFYSRLVEGKESWTDPMVVEAYQWLRRIVNEYLYPEPYAYEFPMAWMKLNKREAAMQLQGEWVDGMWQRVYNYSPKKDYDYFTLPPINPRVKRTMVVGGNAWIAFKRSPNQEKSMKFLKYAGSREAHELLAREGMGILSRRDVPPKVYNKVLRRLVKDLSRSNKVPELGVFLSQEFINFEGEQRLQILLSPSMTRKKIVELLGRVEKYRKKLSPLD